MFDAETIARAQRRLAYEDAQIQQAETDLSALVLLLVDSGLPHRAAMEALGWSRSTLYRRLAEAREAEAEAAPDAGDYALTIDEQAELEARLEDLAGRTAS